MITSVKKAIRSHGLAAIANAYTPPVSLQAVSKWAHNFVPPGRAPAFECLTGVPVEESCPIVAWHRVPDPDWPHPLGRPVVDYTAAPKDSA